jgi:hypothetical protein
MRKRLSACVVMLLAVPALVGADQGVEKRLPPDRLTMEVAGTVARLEPAPDGASLSVYLRVARGSQVDEVEVICFLPSGSRNAATLGRCGALKVGSRAYFKGDILIVDLSSIPGAPPIPGLPEFPLTFFLASELFTR